MNHQTIIDAPEDAVRLKLDAVRIMLEAHNYNRMAKDVQEILEAMRPKPAPLEYGVDYGAWAT
jgi:methyl coenzyme M reductase subunit D